MVAVAGIGKNMVKLAISRGLATGSIIVFVFEVSVARRFWFSAPQYPVALLRG